MMIDPTPIPWDQIPDLPVLTYECHSPREQFGTALPPVIENSKDGSLFVFVPGGKCLVGEPAFEVNLPAYYLALHPVTNGQYEKFVAATQHRVPNNEFWQAAGKADHPVTDVSWDDAVAYCLWSGLRLPRELEWEKGARWLDGRKYPWGNEWTEKLARSDKSKGSGTTSGVWSHAAGQGPLGLYQMTGNVWEWCVDWYDKGSYDRYSRCDLTPPETGSSRVVRGGSWLNGHADYFQCSRRVSYTPDVRNVSIGFRCVSEVESSH